MQQSAKRPHTTCPRTCAVSLVLVLLIAKAGVAITPLNYLDASMNPHTCDPSLPTILVAVYPDSGDAVPLLCLDLGRLHLGRVGMSWLHLGPVGFYCKSDNPVCVHAFAQGKM